jgi:hypothetical protein
MFTLDELKTLDKMEIVAAKHGEKFNQSHILRAGLRILSELSEEKLMKALSKTTKIPRGRPTSK